MPMSVTPPGGLAALHAPRRSSLKPATVASDLLPVADFLLVLGAAWLSTQASMLWRAAPSSPSGGDAQVDGLVLIAAVLSAFMMYDPHFGKHASRGDVYRLLGTFALRFAALCGVVFAAAILSPESALIQWLTLWCAFSAMLLLAARGLAAGYLGVMRRRGALAQAIAVVGTGMAAERLVSTLLQAGPDSVELLGVFDAPPGRMETGSGTRTGTLDQLQQISRHRRIDLILLAVPVGAEQATLSLLHRLEGLSVPLGMWLQPTDADVRCNAAELVGDRIPVRLLANRPIRRWNAVAKGLEDFVGGALITLMLLPVLGIIAVCVRLSGPGPVIYRQRRHAVNNVEFEIYKFRTMHWTPAAEPRELQQTTRGDARITRVGRFLRASSLDELPQLFNVLRGEMSLVGPRPHAVDMRTESRLGTEITALYSHRHRVKPGMTGWSQVNGARGATDTTAQLCRRVELDLYYIDNWSAILDLKILALTVREVLKRTNAY